MRAFYVTDGHHFPPRGVRGGGPGAASLPFKVLVDGAEEPLPPIASTDLQPGELLLHLLSGGGGYGSPLDREPERVLEDVLSQFISFERARDVYGVIFTGSEPDESLHIDAAATERHRAVLRTKEEALA
jgi:N-methylhydantoinase B